MALPDGFNKVEHLQAMVRRYINKEVREHFKDLGDDFWEPEATTTRGAMRTALTHDDNDPINVTLLRMFLYYFTYGQAQAMQTPIYGVPVTHFDSYTSYRPQIQLYFVQDIKDVDENENMAQGELSFRIMDRASNTITNTDIDKYAKKIAANFTKPNKFIWKKGKHRLTYTDMANGYQLKINVVSEIEGKKIVEQILEIQDHSPDWKYAKYIETLEPTEKYPEVPGNQTILGKVRRKPKRRPREDVKFRRASLLIQGLPSPITLVDTTGRYRNARIYA